MKWRGRKTPTTNSLRDGLILYDQRKGWRGPITNIFLNKNWKETVNKINLDKTLKWEVAQVLDVQEYTSKIKLLSFSNMFRSLVSLLFLILNKS